MLLSKQSLDLVMKCSFRGSNEVVDTTAFSSFNGTQKQIDLEHYTWTAPEHPAIRQISLRIIIRCAGGCGTPTGLGKDLRVMQQFLQHVKGFQSFGKMDLGRVDFTSSCTRGRQRSD